MAVFIKIVSPGPTLFKQERVGFGGKKFTFLKFRTMKLQNDSTTHRKHLKKLICNPDTPMEKLDRDKDPRIIFGGRIIRKLALDELPQFRANTFILYPSRLHDRNSGDGHDVFHR